ncbi:hypothetical protein FOZ60_006160 [Perkinsus olseni]|uniref:histidine kinase n=5 Tax=Perkinsus olseni TaxID=32597 RepID=A0A7J6PFT3_PEROL|nr:hypothetical protein FOZ60_006160 [Perkinsus olseni]
MSHSPDSSDVAEAPTEVERFGLRRLSQVAAPEQRSALTVIALTECVSDAMVVTNLAGEIVAANQATVQLFGYDHSQLNSARMSIFMASESQQLHMPQLQRFIARMVRCKQKDGFWPPDFIHFREDDYPEPIFLIFVLKDMSERKQNELRKETLLANISHEVRTPINGIIGLADALVESEANQGRSAKRLLEVFKDVTEMSKLLSQDLRLKTRPVDLYNALEEAVHAQKRASDKNGVTLILDCPTNLDYPPVVWVDIEKFKLVMGHLLGNACKFTEKGSIRVHVPDLDNPHDPVHDMIDPEFPDRFAAFRVSDTGCGIDEEHLTRIVHPFEQGEEDHALRKFEGLGLGLALVERTIKAHGGKFHIESAGRGRGTSVTITLPTCRRDADAAASIQAKRALEDAQWSPKTSPSPTRQGPSALYRPETARHILLVDEDPMTLAILENLPELADDKWFFHQASTTDAADQWLETHGFVPDLVMVDTDVRGNKAGCEYIKKLREQFSHKLLILCMSTRRSSEILRAAVDARANDFLYKPFDKFQLLSRLECMFALHQLSASAAEVQTTVEFMRRSLPKSVCDRLEGREEHVSQSHQMVSIMLISVTSKISPCSEKQASEMASSVNDLYSFIQQEVREHQLYTIPLVARLVFLVAGGIDDSTDRFLSSGSRRVFDHVEKMVRFGQTVLHEANTAYKDSLGVSLTMHCGPAHGLVVMAAGTPRYILTGATVDEAVAVAQKSPERSFIVTQEVRTQLGKLGYSDDSGIFPLTPCSTPLMMSKVPGEDPEWRSGPSSALFYVGGPCLNVEEPADMKVAKLPPAYIPPKDGTSANTHENCSLLSHRELSAAYELLEKEHHRALVELFELRAEVEHYRKRGHVMSFRKIPSDDEGERRLLQFAEDMENLMDRIRHLDTTGQPLD